MSFGAVAGTLQTLAEATGRLKAQREMRESQARHGLFDRELGAGGVGN